jgi:4-hydroxybutyrate dehydrogenase/sulfolactaldehyde 3-reductase
MDRVGFIGLRQYGAADGGQYPPKQFPVAVFDLSPGPVAALVELGAEAAPDVAALAGGADVVVTMLPGPREVSATVLGPVLAHIRPGSVVLDMSTVDPETTDALAAACAARGIGFVDAPVGRLAAHAERGESLFMVGGTEADVARVRPLLEAMGSTIHHCGPAGSARAPSW